MLSTSLQLFKLHLHIESLVLLSAKIDINALHLFSIWQSFSLECLYLSDKLFNLQLSPLDLLLYCFVFILPFLDLFLFVSDLRVKHLYVWVHFIALLLINVKCLVILCLSILDFGHHGVDHQLQS